MRADGSPPTPPIALCEVQGLVYAAWLGCAELYELDGESEKAARLRGKAGDLKRRFAQSFWLEEERYLALALEKDEVPLRVCASNMGQALWTGIVEQEHAPFIARALMDRHMFSGWGIRTLSTEAATYNPCGYHTGGVWPHDNALVAWGLKRYGFHEEAEKIVETIFEAAFFFEHARLPELFCGHARSKFSSPITYPTACHPQAWASASVPGMLAATLGLEARAFKRQLILRKPRLPAFIPDLRLRDVRLGESLVDITVQGGSNGLEIEVERRQGECLVVMEALDIHEGGASQL